MEGVPSNVRAQSWSALGEFIDFQIQANKGVILGMDSNCSLQAPTSLKNKLIQRFNLIDADSFMSDAERSTPTCVSGSQHIDFIIMTPDVADSVMAAYLLPHMFLTESDHCGIVVDFDTIKLLGQRPSDKTHFSHRRLSLTSPSRIKRYVNHLTKNFTNHNIHSCLAQHVWLSPMRWRQSVHFMIKKITGQPRLEKLRIIQLLEADFNAALKIKIGRQLMRKLGTNNMFGDDMHGGRPGNSEHDALLAQWLVCDSLNQQRRRVSILNLDAKQ